MGEFNKPTDHTSSSSSSLVGDFFARVFHSFQSNKALGLALILAFIALFGFFASQIQFEEDITKLIPSNGQSDITNKVLKEVNFADRIILLLEKNPAGSLDDLTAYADQFLDSVQLHCDTFVAEIQGKVDDKDLLATIDFVYQNLPLFLNQKDYAQIARAIQKDSIEEKTQDNYKTLISPMGIVARKTILKDPLGLSFIGLQKLQQLNIGDNFRLHNSYLVTKDEKNLLLFISPQLPANETNQNAFFVERLYKITEQLNGEFSQKAQGEYYGTTMVAVANAQQIKFDIQTTVGIAMTILLILLIFFYRNFFIPLILFMPTLLGGLFAVGVVFLIKTKTSAISLGIGSVLLGITLDYSLHILTHYRNNQDIKQLYKDVALPILMSSLTTALAFLCLLFLSSEALRDLGLFAAVSVVGASVFALLVIPQLYKPSRKDSVQKRNFIDHFATFNFHRSKILIFACVALLVAACFTYKTVGFNQDISKLNYQSEALKATEKKLDKLMNTASKSVYIAAHGNTVESALTQNDAIYQELKKLKEANRILNYSSVGSVVLSKQSQQKKIAEWNTFWDINKKTDIQTNLINSGQAIGFKPTTFQAFYNLLDKDFQTIGLPDYQKIKGLLVDEYITSKEDFATAVTMVKVDPTGLKPLVDQFATAPQTVVIDRQHLNETFLGGLKEDFNRLIGYSFLAVFLILLLFFRRIELTLITIIPIMLTWLLTVGIMGFFGMEFNILNIIISTFIFGLGVDYSIFITNGLQKEYKYGVKELKTYRTSIVLSVITTILGVGALIFAKHPALTSISAVSIIGIISAMLICFTIQPILFKLWISNRTNNGRAPLRLRTFLHGVFCFTIYGLGGMSLSLFSLTILKLIPISKKKKMTFLHKTMTVLVTIVLYANPFVRKKVVNEHGEDFEKPSIIIANHSSVLDTLSLYMVTHKLIFLVNDWVYSSPIFGALAKTLGYYRVSDGIEDSYHSLKEKIDEGYSLVVFPEGKRSTTNKIKRFHKGAFLLQEKLGVDILPFYLHGNADVLPKADHVIYDGALTTIIGQRIKANDTSYGTDARERTKKITAAYKAKFNQYREELEGTDYFKDILLDNYLYKGDRFYKMIKTDYSVNRKLYKKLSDYLPHVAKIAHLADDYGQINILLSSCSLDRKIATYIANPEQQKIASNCFTNKARNVSYFASKEAILANNPSILLISDQKTAISPSFLENNESVKTIVLIDNANLATEFTRHGFEVKNIVNED